MKNKIELLNGDCLDVLKWTEKDSIDLTVTSPPYDDLRGYAPLPFEKFKLIANELFRVTSKGGVIVWIVADATVKGSETGTSFRQALYFKECGFNLHDTMIWNKSSSHFQNKNRYVSAYEYMFILSKGPPKSVNLIRDKKNKWANTKVHGTIRNQDNSTSPKHGIKVGKLIKEFGSRLNIWEVYPEKRTTIRKAHPATYPEKLVYDHIISWSNAGDTILDPFLGSGTTGVVAKKLNRNFIGIEKDETYFETAKKRIEGK